jgi:tRNA1(Val) A37 N6-methylase TrmN6
MNPPYHDEARHDVSDHAQKRTANAEKEGDLKLWIASAARALHAGGGLTMIHRADREGEIVPLLKKDFGRIDLLPIRPKEDAAPKRIILHAVKGEGRGLTHCANLVLHGADERYTEAADAILRDAKALAFKAWGDII